MSRWVPTNLEQYEQLPPPIKEFLSVAAYKALNQNTVPPLDVSWSGDASTFLEFARAFTRRIKHLDITAEMSVDLLFLALPGKFDRILGDHHFPTYYHVLVTMYKTYNGVFSLQKLDDSMFDDLQFQPDGSKPLIEALIQFIFDAVIVAQLTQYNIHIIWSKLLAKLPSQVLHQIDFSAYTLTYKATGETDQAKLQDASNKLVYLLRGIPLHMAGDRTITRFESTPKPGGSSYSSAPSNRPDDDISKDKWRIVSAGKDVAQPLITESAKCQFMQRIETLGFCRDCQRLHPNHQSGCGVTNSSPND